MPSIPPVVKDIYSLVRAAVLSYVFVRVAMAYRRQGGKLPVGIRRILNPLKWWSYSEWPQKEASITQTRICVPDTSVRNMAGLKFPPATIEVSFEYDANGFRYRGTFSVAFVDMDWATMATRAAVGQTVRVRFDPKNPTECIPVENEWNGFKLWSVG